VIEPLTLTTDDGERLVAEWSRPTEPARGTVVLCHPHPQFGGSMHSVVISPLFEALPRLGYACLRFNFRGVGGSTGSYGDGFAERADAAAALAAASAAAPRPLVCVGFSFGADVALSVLHPAVAGWCVIAPPLRFADLGPSGAALDPRPKLAVLAQRDEFRAADEAAAIIAGWTNARVEVVGGASHFFVGRTDRVITAVGAFADELAATTAG
jgi:alpha/beta superfamily hydrolase